MTAHVRREPKKCSFALIYGERIFTLDVNPARTHNNKTGEKSVAVTHWTRWPCTLAEPDNRDQLHEQWFRNFLDRTNISFLGMYERPPYMSEQMDMFQ